MIAEAWGWAPSEMDRMSLDELMDWYERAVMSLKARGRVR